MSQRFNDKKQEQDENSSLDLQLPNTKPTLDALTQALQQEHIQEEKEDEKKGKKKQKPRPQSICFCERVGCTIGPFIEKGGQ